MGWRWASFSKVLQGPWGQGLGGVGSRKDGERAEGKERNHTVLSQAPVSCPGTKAGPSPSTRCKFIRLKGARLVLTSHTAAPHCAVLVQQCLPAREEEARLGLGGQRGASSAFSLCSAWQEGDVTTSLLPALSEFSQTQQGNSTQLHLKATSHSTPPPSSPV